MDKRLTQCYDLLMKLPVRPGSIDQAGRLLDSFLINCNFEQMKEPDHIEFWRKLGTLFERYRLIRGR